MSGSNETRIVLLGKTGPGKSSLGNTILGDSLLKAKTAADSETSECQAESKVVNGIKTTVVDTPGFFGTNMSLKELKREVVKCIAECAPGPHAFLIVLRVVDRYTDQEKDVINKILEYFSEEALKHAIVVFTHGDQLDENENIERFFQQNKGLKDLVKKCGGRCHVVDNTKWNNNNDAYRNNKFQVTQLLNKIEKMKQSGGYYTNEMLQKVEGFKNQPNPNDPNNDDLIKNLLCIFAGVSVGALLGALFGVGLTPDHPVLGALAGALAGGSVGCGVGQQLSAPGEAALKTVQTVSEVGQVFIKAKEALQGGDSKEKKSTSTEKSSCVLI